MTQKDIFTKAGFSLVETDCSVAENKLMHFLKENYPQVIRDGEINLAELKTAVGLPIDEKVNGYGLNFIGRNVARAKYDQKTDKELKINDQFSRDFDATQNMVLKGDNLDCLKIIKSHYSGQIKCIYIDPPYNTDSDNFLYPDKFDKEEQEVLGLANLSENDMDRLEFSFKTKKSHNGWLSFMYPRLMLARDLLSDNGVIFVSIDDNEQANLKILMDEVFGEENFLTNIIWEKRFTRSNNSKTFATLTEYLLCYRKTEALSEIKEPRSEKADSIYSNPDNDPRGVWTSVSYVNPATKEQRPNLSYEIINPITGEKVIHPTNAWKFEYANYIKHQEENRLYWGQEGKNTYPRLKRFLSDMEGGMVPVNFWTRQDTGTTDEASKSLEDLMNKKIFDFPKPIGLIQRAMRIGMKKTDIILDFFAGSGTTAHAVMRLNAEDGGNRKFILCQIDEPIKEDKPAYKFCIENGLPPVISSITCERIKRAGDKIQKEVKEENAKAGLFEEGKKEFPDIGFKVFDLVDAPKLALENEQIVMQNVDNDSFSRIYNMIFQVGIDNPTDKLESVLENCMYKIGNNYYITNAAELDKQENKHFLSDAIKNGKVFIDGWTASINTTLQNYKEDVKIVF